MIPVFPERDPNPPEEPCETAVCENCDRRVLVEEIRTVRSVHGETSQCEECREIDNGED
jgi:hypothetical protein